LAAYERGGKTQPEIAAVFGISVRTFQRWLRAWRTEGRAAPGHSPGRPAVFVGPAAERLRREVARHPDATLHELADRLGNIASYVTVHRALERLKLRYKKNAPGRRARPTGRDGGSGGVAVSGEPDRSGPLAFHRRKRGQDDHGAVARSVSSGAAAVREGPGRPLAHDDDDGRDRPGWR